MPKGDNTKQLEDHSKRLARLEQAYVHYDNMLSGISLKVTSIIESLFGSDDPHAISLKDQIRQNTGLLQSLSDELRDFQKHNSEVQNRNVQRLSDLEVWQKTKADTFIEEHKERTKENKKDWKQFAMQGLFWFLTFMAAAYLAKLGIV